MCGDAQLRRLKALNEVSRLLRVGGRALVYVWAVEQEKDNVKSKYLRQSKTSASIDSELGVSPTAGDIPNLPIHINGTAFKAQDVLVPWHLKKNPKVAEHRDEELMADSSTAAATEEPSGVKNPQILHRYYHTFVSGELQRLCELVAGVQVVDSYYDQGNWCVIIERIMDVEV